MVSAGERSLATRLDSETAVLRVLESELFGRVESGSAISNKSSLLDWEDVTIVGLGSHGVERNCKSKAASEDGVLEVTGPFARSLQVS